jgi:altronate dehydratase
MNQPSIFRNADGTFGVRKHVAVLSLSSFCNRATSLISEIVRGTVPLTHPHGRNEIGLNKERFWSSLLGIALNPNVYSVLVVGYEPKSTADFIRSFKAESKKRIESTVVLDAGLLAAVHEGSRLAVDLVLEASEVPREPAGLGDLCFGIKCGGSDTTSGVASNPAVGKAVDNIIAAGGTAIFSETTEIIGAEDVLAKRAANKKVADRLYQMAKANEQLALSAGVDLIGTNPVPDNIRGGITTIEEKSLGAILKAGNSPIRGVLRYEERPREKGLFFMDSPSGAHEVLTALSAAGCQIIFFSTGTGNPVGSPITPILKITGNPKTARRVQEHIDVDVSEIIAGSMSLDEAGKKILEEAIKVAKGKLTKAEILEHREFSPIPTGL